MNFKALTAGTAVSMMVLAQAAVAGSLAPVVDCNVTPEAEECAVVTLAPTPSSSAGLGGLGAAGVAAGVAGVVALGASIAAATDDDDDDDDAVATTTAN